MRRPPTLHRLAPAIIALVITGCALDAQKSGIRSSEHEALQRAQRAEQSGDYETAAREYTALAAQFSELKRPAYMLRAAGILLRGNHIDQARRVLAGIDIGTLNPHQRVQHRVVAARIALADNKPQAALDLLREDPPADTPAAVQSDLHELRADGYQRLGKLVESAYQRVLRESFIDTSEQEALDRNRQTIWQTLLRLPQKA